MVIGFDFKSLFIKLREDLVKQPPFLVGEWQSQKTEMAMRELRNVSFSMMLPASGQRMAEMTGAHLPWAEDHFKERVGGEPLNPSPSEAWWPFRKKSANGDTNAEHKSEGEAFSHTYPERMWPKYANGGQESQSLKYDTEPHQGIRFEYGDLNDVVNQLVKTPHTRQAFLPLWFPEDTGAVHGKRVPCTLGYHFAIRNNQLDITYYMRSTDLLRHFQDDIYLAGRLAQWVATEINTRYTRSDSGLRIGRDPVDVGELIFHTANLHIFDGDIPMINLLQSRGQAWAE